MAVAVPAALVTMLVLAVRVRELSAGLVGHQPVRCLMSASTGIGLVPSFRSLNPTRRGVVDATQRTITEEIKR